MNKTKKILISLAIFTMLAMPAFSFAQNAPVVTTSEVSKTSVSVKATGLTPGQAYRFSVLSPTFSGQYDVVAGSDGTASAFFSRLPSNETFPVYLFIKNPNSTISDAGATTLRFKTLEVDAPATPATPAAPATDPATTTPDPSATATPGSTTPLASAPITLGTPASGTASPLTTTPPATPVSPSSSGNKGLIPCGNTGQPTCDFDGFMKLINTVIKFVLFDLAVPISAIMFFYAGFELVTSGGSTEKRGIAKKVFTNAVLGLAVAAGAWLIVRTILSILGFQGDWIGF